MIASQGRSIDFWGPRRLPFLPPGKVVVLSLDRFTAASRSCRSRRPGQLGCMHTTRHNILLQLADSSSVTQPAGRRVVTCRLTAGVYPWPVMSRVAERVTISEIDACQREQRRNRERNKIREKKAAKESHRE